MGASLSADVPLTGIIEHMFFRVKGCGILAGNLTPKRVYPSVGHGVRPTSSPAHLAASGAGQAERPASTGGSSERGPAPDWLLSYPYNDVWQQGISQRRPMGGWASCPGDQRLFPEHG